MLNKAIMMGRLCADPEFRQTASGIPSCRFRIAINRPKKQDGTQDADFINCIAWRGTAELVSRYFSKGSMILIDGQMRNNDYTDNNGVKHYGMELLCENVSFCESKNSSGAAPAEDQTYYGQQQYGAAPQQYQGQQYQGQPYQTPPPQYGSIPPQHGNPYYPNH